MRGLYPVALLLLISSALALSGCSVRKAEPQATSNPIDPEMKMFAFDPANVSVADRTATLEDFPKLLTVVGKSDAYHQWNEAFVQETQEAVQELLPGEALEEMFYVESGRGLEEVRIRLMKADAKIALLRLTTSNPQLAQVLQADLNQAIPNPPKLPDSEQTFPDE